MYFRAGEEGRDTRGSRRGQGGVPSLTAGLDQEVNGRDKNRGNEYQSRASDSHTSLYLRFPHTHQGHSRMCPSSENLLDTPQIHTTSGCCQGSWALEMLILSLDLSTGTGWHRRNRKKGATS